MQFVTYLFRKKKDTALIFITVKATADRDLEHKNEAIKRQKALDEAISALQVQSVYTI